MPIDTLSVLCAQLTRDLLAIAKFLLYYVYLYIRPETFGTTIVDSCNLRLAGGRCFATDLLQCVRNAAMCILVFELGTNA